MDEKKTNPIDTPKEVDQSNDPKIDQDFPGYPHYPAEEDIIDPKNHTERVEANLDNLTEDRELEAGFQDKKKAIAAANPAEITGVSPDETKGEEDGLARVRGTGADVAKEDGLTPGKPNRDLDENVNEEIFSEGSGSAFAATEETVSDFDSRDLRDEMQRAGHNPDGPGAGLNSLDKARGQGDKENRYNSLGGSRRNSMEGDATVTAY